MPQTNTLIARDGWSLRWGLWAGGSGERGTVVVQGGRTEFLEGYDQIAGEWVRRGYRVYGLDWRGQGLSGRFLANRHKGYVPDFNLLADDLDQFLADIVLPASNGRLPVLFAHSMGGLITTLYLSRPLGRGRQARPERVVLSAPMLDLRTRPLPRGLARALADGATTLGFGERYTFGSGDYDPVKGAVFEGNVLTSDPEQFMIWHRAVAANPDLALGGPTFGWASAAFRAFDALARPGVVEGIDLPLLVLTTPDDGLIPATAHPALHRRLPHSVLCSYPGARHELLREALPIRQRVWLDIDRFLAHNT